MTHSRRLGTRGEFVIFYQDLNLTASLAKEEKNEILKVLTKFCLELEHEVQVHVQVGMSP